MPPLAMNDGFDLPRGPWPITPINGAFGSMLPAPPLLGVRTPGGALPCLGVLLAKMALCCLGFIWYLPPHR